MKYLTPGFPRGIFQIWPVCVDKGGLQGGKQSGWVRVSMTLYQIKALKDSFSFRRNAMALKYLGTFIPPRLKQTYARSFPPLLNRVRALLSKWHQGLFSWFGRCNIIKMTILPKFLYLFQTLPIHIPPEFFKQINTLIINFIWAYKRPRLQRQLMTMPKQYGYPTCRNTTRQPIWGD